MKTEHDNNYQGYEVQKHRAIMRGKMYAQLIISCLVAQLILFLILVQLLVPLLHRELALYWPIARVQQMVKMDKVFLLHATKDRLTSWSHDKEGNFKMSGRNVAGLSYRAVFTAPKACLNWAFSGSFLAWILFPLGLRFFNRSTAKINKDEHRRGARLITEKMMAANNDGTGILHIGKDGISESRVRPVRENLRCFASSWTRSRKRNRRAIVNDFKGELVTSFYSPGIDLIINPGRPTTSSTSSCNPAKSSQ